ncbi:MAG: hypothetical protein LH614_15645 [Pyrinomonadaceae bacterium]|nr:hypothetical protein [Pyrinomonadaceae bacterium]
MFLGDDFVRVRFKSAKRLNGIKVDFKNSKIGAETNWTRWKKTKNIEK